MSPLATPEGDDAQDDWPKPSPEKVAQVAQAPEPLAVRVFGQLMRVAMVALVFAIPAVFVIAPRVLGDPAPPPVVEVEGSGYFMRYDARLGYSKHGPTTVALYIGRDAAGNCLVGNQPDKWDVGNCEARLRQIEANDCQAVPAFRDEHCEAMGLGHNYPGRERRAVPRILFRTVGTERGAHELPPLEPARP